MKTCPTCGLGISPSKEAAHAASCASWRAAIERGEEHGLIAAYWRAASGVR